VSDTQARLAKIEEAFLYVAPVHASVVRDARAALAALFGEAGSSAAGSPVGERQGRQPASSDSVCVDGNAHCDGTDLLHGPWCAKQSDTQARLDAITVALDRLLEQDSWEQPYVNAGREALTALAAELERVTAVNETLRAAARQMVDAAEVVWGMSNLRSFEDSSPRARLWVDATLALDAALAAGDTDTRSGA
jgi:hypothetical protein